MRVYFDACVWIDYGWGIFNKTGKIKPRTQQLINCIQKEKIEVILSIFLISEISAHFSDWILMQKAIKDGFGYREFSKIKKNYELTYRDKTKIENLTKKIFELSWITNAEIKTFDKMHFDALQALTWDYSLDTVDAIHAIIAKDVGCEFLITKDEDLISHMNEFLKSVNDKTYRVVRPEHFIDIISKHNKLSLKE